MFTAIPGPQRLGLARGKCLARIALSFAAAAAVAFGQTPARKVDKAEAYYRYSLGRLYSELAGMYGNRGDYFAKAIENLRAALRTDPDASFIAEELSDLYIQSGRLRAAVNESEEILRKNPDDLNERRILARIYTRMIGDSQQNRLDESMLRKATEQYGRIVEKDPRDLSSWLMLGRLYKVSQNSVDSEKAYQKALEIDPDNEDALTGLALVYSGLGDNKRAADAMEKAARKNPSARNLTALASSYEEMREYALAAETLKKALELSPPNAGDLKRALAQDLLLAENFDEAEKVYTDLAAEDPKDVLSHLRLSQIYRQRRQFDKARAAADRARDLDPDNLEVRFNEVNLLEAEGKFSQAVATLKDLLAQTAKRSYSQSERSNRVLLMERLAQLHRNAEQTAAAVAVYREVAELDPDMAARSAAQIADTYRLGKEYAKAEQEAEAAYQKFPGDRLVRLVRASVLAETGKLDIAVEDVKQLLDGKDDRETHISLAQLYEKGKRYDEMARQLDAADKLSRNDDDRETIAFMRGAMFEKQKKFEQSEAEFRKVLRLNPNSAAAMNYLGYMLADRNERLNEALDLIRKAVEQEPHNAAYLDSLGWVYYRLGRYDEAEAQLKRSLERSSRDPTVHDHLGDVYAKQGKLKDAVAQWQLSLKEWETSSVADRDAAEVAKVTRKLESAKVKLARESGRAVPNH
jgi:tetratricopeptide (TPR) repeat protein